MTREDRAREALAVQYEAHGYKHVACAVRRNTHALASPIIAAAMVHFADAEAAAMRERAAKKADSWAAREEEEGEGGGRVWSASLGIAAAIRALPATGEVGRD